VSIDASFLHDSSYNILLQIINLKKFWIHYFLVVVLRVKPPKDCAVLASVFFSSAGLLAVLLLLKPNPVSAF
jgi:hypothetical protein